MPEDKTPISENNPVDATPADAAAPAEPAADAVPADGAAATPDEAAAPAVETAADAATPEGDIETDPVEMVVCAGCKAEIDTTEVPAFTTIACPACGTEVTVPAKFGAFKLLKVIGSGGMGSVFLGQDDALNRKVAIKVVKRSIGGNPKMLEGFQREAQATAKLNHPNIVQIYAFGQEKGQPYIAMELVAGGSLDGLIDKKVKLDPAFVLRVGKEIAIALGAAQEAGLIHGDVKPENILFDESYRAKLVDFGIASALSADVNTKEIWGTPYYIAPEKAKGKKADIRSDLYSLGATLYHALTLHPPFDGPDARAVVAARFAGPAAPIGRYRPDAEKEAVKIIERMMHPNPMLRFPNVGALVSAIDDFLKTVSPARAEKPLPRGASVRIAAAKSSQQIASAATGATGAVEAAGPSTTTIRKGGKKIIIAKGGHRPKLVVPGAEDAGTPTGTYPSAEVIPPGGIPEMVVETEPKKSGAKAVVITIIVVIALLLLGAIGVVVHLVAGQKASSHESAARVAEALAIDKASESYDQRVTDAAAHVIKIDNEARKYVGEIESIVSKATETNWTAPSLDPTEEILIDPPKPETKAEDSAKKEEAPAPAAEKTYETLKAVKDDSVFVNNQHSATRKAILAFAMDRDTKDIANDPELIKSVVAALHDPENMKDADVMEIAVQSLLDAAKEKAASKAADGAGEGGTQEADAAAVAQGLAEALSAMGGEAAGGDNATPEALANAMGNMMVAALAQGLGEALTATAGDVTVTVTETNGAEPEHELVTKAKTVLEAARRIRRAAKEAELRRDRQSEMFTPIRGNNVTTQQYNERVRFKQTRENDEKLILAMVEACKKDLLELKKGVGLLDRDSRKFMEKIRERKEAEEKERQVRLEEARKQQAADEQQARVQRDLDEVNALILEANEAVRVFDYGKAVKTLSAYKGQYASKEANQVLQNAINRNQRLADLKAFFLTDLHENEGLPWGLGTRDIIDADPEAETITARGGVTADIAKLTLKQWMNLIESLVVKRDPKRSRLNMKQESDLLLDSAIFCIVHGGGSEGALHRAEEFARAAMLKSEMVRIEIPQVAPELKGVLESSDGGL